MSGEFFLSIFGKYFGEFWKSIFERVEKLLDLSFKSGVFVEGSLYG